MASMSSFSVNFEIEPVVKVMCLNESCAHNLVARHGRAYCNLKHVVIDESGKCQSRRDKGQ